LSNEEPGWYQFDSSIELIDAADVPEDLRVICTWRPRDGVKPEVFRFGLYVGSSRIYAVDVGPLDEHKNNKAGKGRPMWMKFVGGIHEHFWSDDGYGYAEKIDIDLNNIEAVWGIFLSGAGINNQCKFSHPDKAVQHGQKELGL